MVNLTRDQGASRIVESLVVKLYSLVVWRLIFSPSWSSGIEYWKVNSRTRRLPIGYWTLWFTVGKPIFNVYFWPALGSSRYKISASENELLTIPITQYQPHLTILRLLLSNSSQRTLIHRLPTIPRTYAILYPPHWVTGLLAFLFCR